MSANKGNHRRSIYKRKDDVLLTIFSILAIAFVAMGLLVGLIWLLFIK